MSRVLSDVNNELHLGTLRRRELASTNNFPDNVQPTKYNVQKTKDLVKRQRPKGQYHGGTEENSKVDFAYELCYFFYASLLSYFIDLYILYNFYIYR